MNRSSIQYLKKLKQAGEKIACLTAYDAAFAQACQQAELDVLLVGDSLGMVVQGQTSTIPVVMENMIYHAQLVARGAPDMLRIVDMPFASYTDIESTVRNGAALLQQGAAHMVKLEGGDHILDRVRALTSNNIPVCGHLGLLPQSVIKMGAYKVQGREKADADHIVDEAKRLQDAGIDALVVECVPSELGRRITEAVDVPVIGIGAGVDTDGQVLVLYDMLAITPGRKPKFSRDFLQGQQGIPQALSAYVKAVKQKEFPSVEHTVD